jgi:ABC-type antimicrobial peptide transport system permease subunit
MAKFITQAVAIALIAALLQYFLPWWTMAVGAFAVGFLFAESGWRSFLAGLLGVGLLWLVVAFVIDVQTQSILTDKVARLFPTRSAWLLLILTSLIGGLVGGFASLTGSILTYRKRSRW